MLDKTINYYDINAKEFVEGTLNVDFKATQDKFINKLPAKGYILDFGCGSRILPVIPDFQAGHP